MRVSACGCALVHVGARECTWMTFLHLNFLLMRFLNSSDLIACGGDPQGI